MTTIKDLIRDYGVYIAKMHSETFSDINEELIEEKLEQLMEQLKALFE